MAQIVYSFGPWSAPWHVAAMSRTDTKGAGPNGSRPWVTFPLSLSPPHFLLLAPPLQAPPSFFLILSGGAAAFESAASSLAFYLSLSNSHSLSPSLLHRYLILSFTPPLLLIYLVVHWVRIERVLSVVWVLGFVFVLKSLHFSHFRTSLLFWSVSVVSKWLCHFLLVLETFMCECRVISELEWLF